MYIYFSMYIYWWIKTNIRSTCIHHNCIVYFYTLLLSLAHIIFNCFALSSLKESEVNLSRLLVVTSLQWWDYRCTKQVNLWRVLCKQSKRSSLYDEFQQETLVVTINLTPFIKMITRIILRNKNTIFEYTL